VLRLLLWRVFGLVTIPLAIVTVAWFLRGGPGQALRGSRSGSALHHTLPSLLSIAGSAPVGAAEWLLGPSRSAAVGVPTAICAISLALVAGARWRSRRRRRYVRLRIEAYRTDVADAAALVRMFDALHKRLLRRWWRRLLAGQPSVSLEVRSVPACCAERRHMAEHGGPAVWLAVTCPSGLEAMVETAIQNAYPNCRLGRVSEAVEMPATVLRLRKQSEFIKRVKVLDRFEHERAPPMNRLMTVMGACEQPAVVQVALTPTPASFERLARHLYRSHEAHIARERREHIHPRDRSLLSDAELRGGLELQHRALFFVDIRVVAPDRGVCERVASELRAEGAENRLVERGTAVRHGVLGLYERRVQRGEGNALPSLRTSVFAATELASVWQLPSVDYMTVPFERAALPLAPAPPSIFRPRDGDGTLRDAHGGVSIHVELRKQNTAVPGTVEQGKSSYLVASVAEDLRRDRCAVIVLDPKGDAAEAAVSLVPTDRTCTLLDFSSPTCGFNPLDVEAPADVIADYVVAALKSLFTDADIRASSDRYLRNAIIAVLAHDRGATLWDAARLLSVGEEGYAYRRSVGAAVRALPEFREISQFFTSELSAQLADARSVTTAKLDAPVNKLARLLNSPSIKRVLLNDSLRVDLDRVIAHHEVLVVKGALGAMGAGNTSVLMQLIVGMLDAALARQQDLVPEDQRVAVALKIDEAPLVLNRGFAETMALKRSAGLETVASWQTDAQWTDSDVREQLDALFAHRVYFATASARDARAAVALTMSAFSDTVRPGIAHLSALGQPDLRLHLPKHHAVASWTTAQGRQAPFVASTIPLRVDRERLALHRARQAERGGRPCTDLRQPHWESRRRTEAEDPAAAAATHGLRAQETTQAARGLPSTPAESYRELTELDAAQSVRWARKPASTSAVEPEDLDLEILALVAEFRHLLTSQIHRRFNAARSITTTQRRLKRLSDAGLLERFQFHRRDGGGVPMCYVITPAGLRALPSGPASGGAGGDAGEGATITPSHTASRDPGRRLRQARQDVHGAAWALALERIAPVGRCGLRGPERSVVSPPTAGAGRGFTPADLRLPSGRTPHDFLRIDAAGATVEIEHFETIRPSATVELAGDGDQTDGDGERDDAITRNAVDVLLELDDRLPSRATAGKLERYDHFLTGWALHTRRYGRRREAVPIVVFVCRDRARARECARRADPLLRACRAYAGDYPADWDYRGRASILFASERDVHEGLAVAYGVPRQPPEVRVAATGGDPRAGEAIAEPRDII
jgi:hypothetical protein